MKHYRVITNPLFFLLLSVSMLGMILMLSSVTDFQITDDTVIDLGKHRLVKRQLESNKSIYEILESSQTEDLDASSNGESDEMIVATLLHDIGDDLAPMNHSQYAASILRPYVSERTYWIILHHGLFQTYYSAHHLGGDRNARDKFKDHKYYQDTIDFCEKYDQCSFDPEYKSMSLEDFTPLIRKIFSKEPYYYL